MTKLILRPGDPLEKALRILKKKLDKEGVLRAARKFYHEKPSIRERRKAKAAIKYKRM